MRKLRRVSPAPMALLPRDNQDETAPDCVDSASGDAPSPPSGLQADGTIGACIPAKVRTESHNIAQLFSLTEPYGFVFIGEMVM